MIDPKDKDNLENIPQTWDDKDLGQNIPHHHTGKNFSFVNKFLLVSILVFIFSTGLFLYSFFSTNNSFSENKIAISDFGPGSLTSGEEGEITVTVTNNNDTPLLDSYILTKYDSGESSSGNTNLETKKIQFGDILPRTVVAKTFPIVLFGAEGTTKDISPILFYKLAKSKAEFNKDGNVVTIILKSSPVTINVDSLKEMHQNKEEEFKITLNNSTINDIKNLLVSVRTPNDFVFKSSNLPILDNTPSWVIASLPAKSSKSITMTGKFIGPIGTYPSLTFYTGTNNLEKSTTTSSSTGLNNFDNFNPGIDNVLSRLERKILIGGQYLNLNIISDNSNGDPLKSGQLLILEIAYKNVLSFPIDNVRIDAKITGNIDVVNSVAQDGFFDPKEKTFFWDKDSLPALSKVSPAYEGKLRLQIRIPNNAKDGETIHVVLSGIADRNGEENVSNYQDVSLEQSWKVLN